MDDRFPKVVRFLVRKLEFLTIPNLGPLLCGIAVLAFLAQQMWNTPYERFVFDPQAVLAGEWWRLVAFPISSGITSPIWLIFYCLYLYFIMQLLEVNWGATPLTVYVLFSYMAALGASLATGRPVAVWLHVLENVSLAFGTLFPDYVFYLYFVLPVKAKWLSLLAGALLLFRFIMGGWDDKVFIVVVLLPYLLFFGPYLVQSVRNRRRVRENRRRFDQDMWR